MDLLSLKNKRVLVTGASRGIGFGIAEAFVHAGAEVHILANDDGVKTAAERLSQDAAHAVVGYQCDVRDGEQIHHTLDALGSLDVLVNNAGFEKATPLRAGEDEAEVEVHIRRLLDVNVTGMFLMMREALKHLVDGAAVVNTASVWGKTAPADFSMYAASKHAVIGLTRSWSKELADRRIRVNAVCPGWVATEPALASLRHVADEQGISEQAAWQQIEVHQSLPGMMQPTDVAGAYLYLASALAASVTGQTLVVDRGEIQS